jgi:hypothetical protein
MADKKQGKGTLGKTLKLFAIIFVVLLVPMVMDQFDMDREDVKLVGRIAAGLAIVLFLYGIFSKLFKVLAFVVLLLIGGVVLVSEDQVKAPRVKELFGGARK